MANTVKLEVTRAFYLGGVVQEVGSVVEVAPSLAIELQSMGKAAPAAEKPKKAAKAEGEK